MNNNIQPHINLGSHMTQAKYALLPGDHKRLDRIMPLLDNVEQLAFNREYRSLKGTYQGVEVLAISTGIGGPSTAIALHELSAIGVNNAIRIGSCGALQTHLALGELILASGAVRDEGTSTHYIDLSFPAVSDTDLLYHLKASCIKNNFAHHVGVVRSHDTFYTEKEMQICDYWSEKGVLGADMETATLFVVGRLLGMRTASILNVVVKHQDNVEDGISNYVQAQSDCLQGEINEIKLALDAIYADANQN